MFPSIEKAEELLQGALVYNPGLWGEHSRVVAFCAEKIAENCEGLDSEKAYVLGLLHDIGRKLGTRHLGHTIDGFRYMDSLGYDEVAKICLTHSFNNKDIGQFIGNFDVSDEELIDIKDFLSNCVYDEYDILIQSCDALVLLTGVVDIETRMMDLKNRYGSYPKEKWDSNLYFKTYFENKIVINIYMNYFASRKGKYS